MIVSLFTATITEVVSNTAAANILLPILKEMSITLCANPTYLGNLSKRRHNAQHNYIQHEHTEHKNEKCDIQHSA